MRVSMEVEIENVFLFSFLALLEMFLLIFVAGPSEMMFLVPYIQDLSFL